MARKKDSPQKAVLKEMMSGYMKENGIRVKDGTDVNSIMRDMMSVILEGALDEELDIPRDRKGEFEPQLIKKYQNTVTQDMKEKIISMYAKSMTTGDIESHMRELYYLDISDSTISRITKYCPSSRNGRWRIFTPLYFWMPSTSTCGMKDEL